MGQDAVGRIVLRILFYLSQGYVFSALFFTVFFSPSLFSVHNNQVSEKDSLLLETLAATDIRRAYGPNGAILLTQTFNRISFYICDGRYFGVQI